MKKDLLQKLRELQKARSKTLAEILQLTNGLKKKLDQNNDSGSSDGLGSASMSMKMLELQFTAAVQYFNDLEDPDKEAVEILNELTEVVDILEMSDVVDLFSAMQKVVPKATEYKLKHTGEELTLNHEDAMSLIKEFVSLNSSDDSKTTVKDALAALEKMEAEDLKKTKSNPPTL